MSPLNFFVETLLPPAMVGIRRWGLWEVTRIRWGYKGRALMNGISILKRVSKCLLLLSCSLLRLRTKARRQLPLAQEAGPHQTPNPLPPCTATSQSLELWEILLFKPSNLWHSVTVARKKTKQFKELSDLVIRFLPFVYTCLREQDSSHTFIKMKLMLNLLNDA